jgi:prepilin-type N-terminal cleavage/methylation domain-containing protein
VKKAFSLIELLIVIVIIGVVYTLAITNLQNVKEEKITPSFDNLKEYLRSFLEEDTQEVRLLCLDDCTLCSVYRDTQKVKEIESFFDDSVQGYRYDMLQGAREIQNDVFFNKEGTQEDVCFSFSLNRNLVTDQVIVVYKEKAYDFSSYFEKPVRYDYLEEAIDAREKLRQEVMQ